MWNFRNKTDEHVGRRKTKREREANHKRLLRIENKLRVNEGRWGTGGLDGWWALRRKLVMSTGC